MTENAVKRISPLIVLVIGGMIGLLAVIGGANPPVFLAITGVVISLIVIVNFYPFTEKHGNFWDLLNIRN